MDQSESNDNLKQLDEVHKSEMADYTAMAQHNNVNQPNQKPKPNSHHAQ